MSAKKFLSVSTATLILAGCATQPPAPVIGGYPMPAPRPPVIQKPVQPQPVEPPSPVQTTPLRDYQVTPEPVEPIENIPPKAPVIREEPLPLPPKLEEPDAALDSGNAATTLPDMPELSTPAIMPAPAPTQLQPDATPVVPEPLIPEPPKPPVVEKHTPLAFEPFESSTTQSPAIGALVADARQTSKAGELEQSVTTIERAIRIEPRNPDLYYKLAVIRLQQSKPRLAEDLAKKSALLASKDKQLKKHSWLLIAKARDMQKDYDGSKEALKKANGF